MAPQTGGDITDKADLNAVREMPDGEFRFWVASALWEISTKLKYIRKHQQAHADCILAPRSDDILHHLDDLAAERRHKKATRGQQLFWFASAGGAVGILSNLGRIWETIRGWFT